MPFYSLQSENYYLEPDIDDDGYQISENDLSMVFMFQDDNEIKVANLSSYI